MRMSRKVFDGLVERAIADLPERFALWLDEVAVIVEDEPSPALRRTLGVDEEGDLLGSYHGVALTRRSVGDDLQMPDQIMLFRRPLMKMCKSEEELADEIRITLLHELGHYAGLDEDDLEDLGYG